MLNDFKEAMHLSKKEYKRRWKVAKITEKNARIFTSYALSKMGFHSISLESRKGFESTGIVDLVAVRKLFKEDPDKVEIVLLQRKGNVRVSKSEIDRLKNAVKIATVKYGIAEYKKGRLAKLKIYE